MALNTSQGPVQEKATAADVLDSGTIPPVTESKTQSVADPVTEPESEKVSPKLQLLIQRERQALQKEMAAKKAIADAEARVKAAEARLAKLDEFERVKSTNPRRALELMELSYEDLTKAELNDGQIPPEAKIKQVESKLDGFLKTQEEDRKAQAESQRLVEERKAQEADTNFKSEISKYIKDNPVRYEFIGFEQHDDLVYDVISEYYDRTLKTAMEKAEADGTDPNDCRGDVMPISEAADKVELHLEKKYDKAKSLNKFQTLLAPRQAQKPVEKPKTPERPAPRTLNNALNQAPAKPSTRPLTDDERIAKAIAYARGLRPSVS